MLAGDPVYKLIIQSVVQDTEFPNTPFPSWRRSTHNGKLRSSDSISSRRGFGGGWFLFRGDCVRL